MSAACEVQDKLKVIAGPDGYLTDKLMRARGRLARINNDRWRSPLAPGRIWRFWYGKQKPEAEEVDDVRAAYQRFLDERYEHAKRVVSEIDYLRQSDEDFHREAIEQRLRLLEQISPLLFRAQQQGARH